MKRRSKLLIIVLLALTAAVIVYALFFMGQGVETSAVAMPTSGASDGVESTDSPGYNEARLTTSNVQAVLAELSRAENYSAILTIEDHWDGGSASQELHVWVSGGRVRIRGSAGGSSRNILVADGTLYIWSDSVSGVYSAPYSQNTDIWMRSLTYEDVLDLPVDRITDASYEQFSGTDCIYVQYNDGSNNYVNRIYVSVSTGLLMGAETIENGELIYRMYSTVDLSTPEDGLFTPPEA